jgi:hypothetical protein
VESLLQGMRLVLERIELLRMFAWILSRRCFGMKKKLLHEFVAIVLLCCSVRNKYPLNSPIYSFRNLSLCVQSEFTSIWVFTNLNI